MSLDERSYRAQPFGPEDRSFYEPAPHDEPARLVEVASPARLVALEALEREFRDLLARSA